MTDSTTPLPRRRGAEARTRNLKAPIAVALLLPGASRSHTVRPFARRWAERVGCRPGIRRGARSALILGAYKLAGVVRLGALDDVRGVLLIIAAVWFCVAPAAGRRPGERRFSWGHPLALFVAGSVADAALAPSSTLIGPILVALWLAWTAPHRGEALHVPTRRDLYRGVRLVPAGGFEFMRYDGGIARSAALGLLFVITGLFDARDGAPTGGLM